MNCEQIFAKPCKRQPLIGELLVVLSHLMYEQPCSEPEDRQHEQQAQVVERTGFFHQGGKPVGNALRGVPSAWNATEGVPYIAALNISFSQFVGQPRRRRLFAACGRSPRRVRKLRGRSFPKNEVPGTSDSRLPSKMMPTNWPCG